MPRDTTSLYKSPTEEVESDLHVISKVIDLGTSADQAPFVIDNEKKANWLVRKIVQAREYGQRVKRWAAQEQHRAEAEEERLLYLYGGQLEAWGASQIAKFNGRRKSLHLPAGQIGFRHLSAKIVVMDEDAVKAWAREHCPHAIHTVENLLKSAINSHFETTGEIPPAGIRLESERESFYIK